MDIAWIIHERNRKDAKNIGIHVILQRNEHFFSRKPGFIAFTALRPWVLRFMNYSGLERFAFGDERRRRSDMSPLRG